MSAFSLVTAARVVLLPHSQATRDCAISCDVFAELKRLTQALQHGGHPASACEGGSGVQQDIASQSLDQEVLLKVKTEIEEELKSLDKEISEAFASTGFDRHTSPVFSPANPDSSVDDCLAHVGEKALQELRAPLLGALQTLLSR
ncbi:bcl-2-like protein 13 [Physeter macrocephalus]|uniref:Bcl-2-like protein 13 n=1 Tax=Physeter macrocephalus TaxID=9755 RepID=A0A9W2WR59_PHYMC|nr:bcl-2-like protein 13 [Physeter catodon]